MAQSEHLIFIDSRKLTVRALLVIAILIAATSAFYGARWQFGRTFAETFALTDDPEIAALAVRLAPDDPQTNFISGKFPGGASFDEQRQNAHRAFKAAVRSSPEDYRLWLELARAREQIGDGSGAEQALRRAAELAPSYASPRWFLGNFLLRDNRRDQSFAEFERAAAKHSIVRDQVFRLLWQTLGDDVEQLKRIVGDAAPVRAWLAAFFAEKNLPAESLQIWQSLGEADKLENAAAGRLAMQLNYDNFNAAAAALLANDLKIESVAINQISNPGFEDKILFAQRVRFGWKLPEQKSIQVSLDLRQPREGARSLRIVFDDYSEPALQTATQLVAVEPNARYRLTFAVRTADLAGEGLPFLEAIAARTAQTLGATESFAAEINDWQTLGFDFTVPPDTTGVILRTRRAACATDVCPLAGAIWYDDFKLERIGD